MHNNRSNEKALDLVLPWTDNSYQSIVADAALALRGTVRRITPDNIVQPNFGSPQFPWVERWSTAAGSPLQKAYKVERRYSKLLFDFAPASYGLDLEAVVFFRATITDFPSASTAVRSRRVGPYSLAQE